MEENNDNDSTLAAEIGRSPMEAIGSTEASPVAPIDAESTPESASPKPKVRKRRRKSTQANIYDVAAEAGVSFVTVSRVFNDHPNVSANMRERVFAAARKVGYSPKLVSRPKVVGVLLGDMNGLNGRTDKSAICTQISRAATQRDFLVQMIPFNRLEVATKRLVDGVIEIDLSEEQLRHLEKIPNVPVVLTHNRSVNPRWSSVTVDYYEEGRAAAGALVAEGHRKIAVVLEQRSGWYSEERISGILDELLAQGIRLESQDIFEISSHQTINIARAIHGGDYTGVMCLANNYCSNVVNALVNEVGVRIPEDLSLLSLDNSSFSRHYNPPISSIEQPLALIAEKAVDELLRLLTDKQAEGRGIQLRSQVQLRNSFGKISSPAPASR